MAHKHNAATYLPVYELEENGELMPVYEINENGDLVPVFEDISECEEIECELDDVELVYVDEDINDNLDKKEKRENVSFHDESMLMMGTIACMEIAETYCDDFCSEVEPFDGF